MSQAIVKKSEEYGNLGTQKYFEWVRLMLSLCTASLTALIALQNNYIPGNAIALYLLWGCWGALAVSIFSAAVILWGESFVYTSLANTLARKAHLGDSSSSLGTPPRISSFAMKALPMFLGIALLLLCSSAILNSAVKDRQSATTLDPAQKKVRQVGVELQSTVDDGK